MKPLVTTAVFGLLPVPPLPDAYDCACKRRRDDAPTSTDAPDVVRSSHVIVERMATPDKLARPRDELEDLDIT